MTDKVLKECSVEISHSRLAEASGSYAQYPSKKQHRIKDKRSQQYYASGSKRYDSGSNASRHSKQRFYSGVGGGGGQRWSEQRNPREEKPLRRDGVREEKALSPGQPSARPGVGDMKRKATPVSLNHLLNFTVAPREHRVGGGAPPASRRRRSKLVHSYNKEQFLQANCQFVVSASGDYEVHTGDPDLLVEWDKIQQVRLFCHQIPSCPICLYPPRAAKISRCGHVYCWSCALHYLSLGDKKWRKCPICYESIYKTDLKSVMALENPQYKVGNTIAMKLMMREKGATQVVPKCDWAEKVTGLPSLEDSSHNKLLTATPAQVLERIIKPEKAELTAQLESLDKDEVSEQCFVESALEELKDREAHLVQADVVDRKLTGIVQGVGATTTKQNSSEEGSDWRSPQWSSLASSYFESEFEAPFSDSDDGEMQESLSSASGGSTGPEDSEGDQIPVDKKPSESESSFQLSPVAAVIKSTQCDEGTAEYKLGSSSETPLSREMEGSSPSGRQRLSIPTEEQGLSQSPPSESSQLGDQESPSSSDSSPRSTGSDFIYFYQASDGQHLYLHPVSAKCLIKEYGSLARCPDEIEASIVEMEQLSMTEEVRSRYRYLSHLPLTCEFVLCELDLKPPTVSRETLRVFSDELQRRRQKRLKKKREEKRRERKTEVQSPQTSMFPVLASTLTPERFHDLLSLTSASPGSSPRRRPSEPSTPGKMAITAPQDSLLQSSPEASTKPNGVSPVPQSPQSDTPTVPSFAQALQGKPPPMWPIKTSPKSHATTEPKPTYEKAVGPVNNDEDECVPSFQEAFNEAVLSASISALAAQADSGGKPGSKTAKKGRKKMVLFSTGGARGTS